MLIALHMLIDALDRLNQKRLDERIVECGSREGGQDARAVHLPTLPAPL